MKDPLLASYEEIPYAATAYCATHPNNLATIGMLLGMTPTNIEECTVLELGCSTGGNLFPMALALPRSRFIGLDFAPRQIAAGREIAQALGLTNVRLEARSILDVDASWGQFDYIICHGVYSWVPEPVQGKILTVCRENLAPDGIAYVSYNTYPGWHLRGMVREMLAYHARQFDDPQVKIEQARSFIEALADSVRGGGPYAEALKEEAELLRSAADTYLYHEHLEEVNRPVYFHQFAAACAEHGLQYLMEARPGMTAVGLLSPAAGKVLENVGEDLIQREQYADFLRNRMFRRTLLCRQEVKLSRPIDSQRLTKMRLSAMAIPKGEKADAATDAFEEFAGRATRTLKTNNPRVKAALHALYDARPLALGFGDLVNLAQSGPGGGVDELGLASAMLQCYLGEMVSLHAWPWQVAGEVSDRPKALAVARLQAAEGSNHLTNARHQTVQVEDTERLVCSLLDGTRGRKEIIQALAEMLADGRLNLERDGLPVREPALVQRALEETVGGILEHLAKCGLLVA